MKFADCHLHSICSFDADRDATFENIVASAEKRGDIFALAITDHFEVNALYEDIDSPYDAQKTNEYITSKIDSYKGPLKLSYGVELAQGYQFPCDALSFLEKYKPTTVNCSLHNARGQRDFYYIDFKNFTQDMIKEMWDKYIKELFEAIELPGIDSLCHLSYPLRYIIATGNTFDISYSYDQIAMLFERMVKKDLCLECNTSLFYREALPPFRLETEEKIFTLYKECGGRLITIGSDAHRPSHIGGGFEKARDMLKRIGFDSLAFVYKTNIETYKI
jgi:histidinol-phosphatase (PHP family)